ncbi:MAG: hypothetical protein OEM38_11880 [Gammaproteobacteria bacterium]|nr:hypothetical protein [Gammaproteobacteria bacterium]
MIIKGALTNWRFVGCLLLIVFFALMVVPSHSGSGKGEIDISTTFLFVFTLLITLWFFVLCVHGLIFSSVKVAKNAISGISSKRQLKKKMLEVLNDGVITGEEERQLTQLVENLGIDENYYWEVRKQFLDKEIFPIISRIRETRRYSPEDEKELLSLKKAHRVNALFEDELFARYRLLWEIENTGSFELKPIATDLRLKKNEECYFAACATWKQEKRVKEHRGYIGGSIGIRVAKGITLRVGRAVPVYDEYDDIASISDGTLYVTNKKIVFLGHKKSTNITFTRLANYQLYRDTIKVIKTSGKPDIFSLDEDDILYLDALLQSI